MFKLANFITDLVPLSLISIGLVSIWNLSSTPKLIIALAISAYTDVFNVFEYFLNAKQLAHGSPSLWTAANANKLKIIKWAAK